MSARTVELDVALARFAHNKNRAHLFNNEYELCKVCAARMSTAVKRHRVYYEHVQITDRLSWTIRGAL